MEEVGTTDWMVILRDKVWCIASSNLLIRADVYDTMRYWTVLPLHQIKTVESEMKIRRIVCINNTLVEDDWCKLKPDSSSGIYMTVVKEARCRIVYKNRRKQDKVNENSKQSNYVKISSRIIKWGSLYDNIIFAVSNLLGANNNTEDSTDYIFQAILPVSSDTLKDAFIHMGVKISYFTELNNWTVALEIERR